MSGSGDYNIRGLERVDGPGRRPKMDEVKQRSLV